MKLISTLILCAVCVTVFAKEKDFLLGTWCVGEDGLVLTFAGHDSLIVTSNADESVGGYGNYQKNDTSFTAVVNNGDMVMEMKYRYRKSGKDTVEALAELFTINGDSVSFPTEWMSMIRCTSPEKQKNKRK